MSGSLPIIHEEPHPPVAPGPQAVRVGEGFFYYGCLTGHDIIPSFAECKRSKLVALVSGSRTKAEQYAGQYGVNPKNIYNYQNYDTIRDNPEVDVIYIILPNALHAEYTIRGTQALKHIMCEKPMAVTVAECQGMIEAAKKSDRKILESFTAVEATSPPAQVHGRDED
jgi:predicted dehydrogenase